MDPCLRPVLRQAAKAFNLPLFEVEEALSAPDQLQALSEFLQSTGPQRLLLYRQQHVSAEGEAEDAADAPIYIASGETDRFEGKGFYILKLHEGVVLTAANIESEVHCSVIVGSPIKTLLATLSQLYLPAFTETDTSWRGSLSHENAADFALGTSRFIDVLTSASNSLDGGVELAKADSSHLTEIDTKQASLSRAATHPELVAELDELVSSWCTQVEELLAQEGGSSDEAGPASELAFWRTRMARLNSVSEQLRGKECKVVVGVLTAAKSRIVRRWKLLENGIVDACNEAKDNVKYLSTLEKYMETLYKGTPAQISDVLPGLLNSIKMMLTISRYYNTAERMVTLLRKLTNQLITRCSQYLEERGKLWQMEPRELISRLRECVALDETYRELYRQTHDSLLASSKGLTGPSKFEVDEHAFFGRFELFCRRLEKLIDMFSTVAQFSSLTRRKVAGMETMLANFARLLNALKAKQYELLDFTQSQFDRDYLEFNNNIQELEVALQSFINQSFESITSTEHALSLLKHFQAILNRESLKDDLDSKLMVIFHNYGLDLETVQLLYEKQKGNPPVVRNAPPVAGNLMWARHLLRRIEEPMLNFKGDKQLMGTKESKKIVKTYNRIACTIIEFETLWHLAWTKSIEASKAGLQATLIIRHPSDGKLYVNFDREILLLIREAKCLSRIGAHVPDSARLVVLQEDKFKTFYNRLAYALDQYERVLGGVLPVTAELLAPHLEDMRKKLQPGLQTLTWTSTNIDAFMHTVLGALARLSDLMSKIRDAVENRIERNLKSISQLRLVELPADESFTLDKFLSAQETLVKAQTHQMGAKNQEVEEAVDDLLELISTFELEGGAAGAPPSAAQRLKGHYSRLLYRAVLNATKSALSAIKARVGSASSTGFLYVERPFFDVNVELSIPHVTMSPSLDEIQTAVNTTCRSILRIGESLPLWGSADERARRLSVWSYLASELEVVRFILVLTGSVESAKRQVHSYLGSFAKYEWLWRGDMQADYAAFMLRGPSLDDFESELKRYVEIEREIAHIAPVHNIGALSLESAPLKHSLREAALAWKRQYAQKLNEKAKRELELVVLWQREMHRNLKRDIKDLDDVRAAIGYLKEMREKESVLDAFLGPVEEMYQLLALYGVRVDREEVALVDELRNSWRKLLSSSGETSAVLAEKQSAFKKELVLDVRAFVADVTQFRSEYEAQGPMVAGISPTEAVERLKRFERLYEQREAKWRKYAAGEELFGLPVSSYPELLQTKHELALLQRLYTLYVAVISSVAHFNEMPWSEVSASMDEMTARIGDFQAQCTRMPKELRQWEAYVELKGTIDDFLLSLPLVQMLAHPSVRSRHWAQLMQITGRQLNVSAETFKLHQLLSAGLLAFSDDVEDIANSALKELQIEEKLALISEEWSEEQLGFSTFKSRGPICLKGAETAAHLERLEETLVALGAMMASRYIAPFREEVQSWITKFSTVSEILEQLMQVQAMWMYLEAVFTSGDIAKQLPQESKRFLNIDKNWEKTMTKAFETRHVVQFCFGNEHLQDLLPHLLEQLEVCQKALSGYLDQKRAIFPRFYFVSDPNLLEILSQGSNPAAIQPHLPSVFAGIVSLRFDAARKERIAQLVEGFGELIELSVEVLMAGNIEQWLNRLLQGMQASVNAIVRNAAEECETLPVEEFTFRYPAQVCLLGMQMKWSLDCEEALERAKSDKAIMQQTAKKNAARLNELVRLNLKSDAELLEHGRWTRTKIETMITVDVHQRDCFDELVAQRIKEASHFAWQKQARFYWRHDEERALISVADVDFRYCNEFLGVKERLVITPLTDRCYITLSQALGMFYGGAPAGPAGTGKTETTKDMGCTLGKYVVVFNCSDQMDYRIMGGIYKGLAQSGCWGCFDEFNRIDLEVLSVVAQQVSSVLEALRQERASFQFVDGQVVSLDREVGFFITMNPGYAGRQELPENLKSLFRGVTMMVPDRQIIMKVKLTACGYKEAALLAKKFDVLYRLCEQQLSKQPHYDFGLRNILAVLRTAGASKRASLASPEPQLLMVALRDMNLSKYVAEDVPLFLSLIEDLFVGVRSDKAAAGALAAALDTSIGELGLQPHGAWRDKVLQVYDMALVRHSLMLVGPSGVGKSRVVEALHGALRADRPGLPGQPHREVRMNPKAITAPQMFGSLDVVANEWTDGVFAQLWRKANKDAKNFTWLVLDGPVDAIWIESLNTVMDDNRILTLANNDRIPMLRPNVTLHFEVEDLRNASPATVSRAGIIYVSVNDLGWQPMVTSYLAARKPAEAELLRSLFDKYVGALLDFMRRECRPTLTSELMGLAHSLVALLSALLDEAEQLEEGRLERLFLFALIWSMGGLLGTADRTRVDQHLRARSDNMPVAEAPDTVYEFRVSEASGEWEHWGARVNPWEPPEEGGARLGERFTSILVPTIDSERCQCLLELSLSQGRAVLLVGGQGTAKTSTVLQVLSKQNPAEALTKTIAFSSATTPLMLQAALEGSIEKRQGRTFGPPGGKRMLVFVDDCSMPEVNQWGDQVTLELVRQVVEFGGLYNLQKPGEWKSIVDLLFVGCMLVPGGGNNDIPNRTKRHFHLLNVTLPSAASIHQIFGSMCAAHFSAAAGVAAPVASAAQQLVDMTLVLWRSVMAKMLPTPAKFHYIFNLRELGRVFQGVFMRPADEVRSAAELLGLWTHECTRVFADRLVSEGEKAWCEAEVKGIVLGRFGAAEAAAAAAPRFYVDFMRPPAEDAETGEPLPPPKVYEPVEELGVLRRKVEEHMSAFNAAPANKLHRMQLTLFEDALAHFVRVARVLALPRGSALLVGIGGSGRQSLTRLASFVCGYSLSKIVVTKTYSANNLLDDFKPLYRQAGVHAKGATFLFTDKEIKEESFLEYINIFLNTGELPNLFPRDELDAILGDVGAAYEAAMPKGAEPSAQNLWSFFVERVRANLHLVLCFSPVGDRFRTRARMFPGLINGCTIDWYLPWPEVALVEVATQYLGDFSPVGEAGVKGRLISHMAAVHQCVSDSTADYFERYRRRVYVTPRSFMSFLLSYQDIYRRKQEELSQLAENINSGLTKLVHAGSDVDRMKLELKDKEKVLAVAQEKSAVLLNDITNSTGRAEKKKAEVQKVKDGLLVEQEAIERERAAINKELEAAAPALAEADAALRAIQPKDIGLLRSLKAPPNLIQRLFDCVLLMMRLPLIAAEAVTVKERLQLQHSWNFAVPAMSKSSFMQDLFNFEKDNVTDEDVELCYPYMAADDYTYADAKKASGNVAGLATWTKAMVVYTDVAKVVKPKMELLKQAEGKLKVANAKLRRAQDELDVVQAELDAMQVDFDAAMATRQSIQADADATQKRMDAANRLIGGLAGERSRWSAQSDAFAEELTRLAGDVALACGFIGYVGPFNADFRLDMLRRFRERCAARRVPMTEALDVSAFMVSQGTVGDWVLQGLPSDELSVQNGIMVTRSSRWPLLIDPQGQGVAWIKRREEKNQLRVSSLSEKRLVSTLEDAMAFGQPLLLEHVEEEIDPLLDPVLDKAVQRSGRGLKLVLADKECEYVDTFSLLLCSRLANPHFSPELSAQVTLINFTVTMLGLEQQLLGRVVQKERAELEEQRSKLAEEVNTNQKVLKQLEDDLLTRLANSTGNLLDDSSLIEVLQSAKNTSSEVQQKLQGAAETDARINTAREEYRPVARRGALAYFLITDMAAINPMYQVSLQQLLELFDSSIGRADSAPLASKRIANIIDYFTFHVTCYMQRGLFERHKQIWALMLTLRTQRVAGELNDKAVQTLLKAGGALNTKSEPKKPHEWLPDGVWLNCLALSRALTFFKDLPTSIKASGELWRNWYDADAPEQLKLPEYGDNCTDFQKLLLVRCVREDRMLLSAQDYIANSIGRRYIDSRPLDLRAVADEAHARCPIIALLSQGSDPTSLVMDLAKKSKTQVRIISLGQGQEPAARKLISTAATQGSWVMLQNCHLGLRFMSEVEVSIVKLDEIAPSFRLWITTEPHPRFPIGLLHLSVKITNEAPAGIRAGLKASYAWINQDMLDAVSQQQWKSLLFALSFLHTIVQERRKFGPLGFNIPYEFNQSDLSACVQFMQRHLNEMEMKKRAVDWECINYMVCNVQYGGRITDDWDRRLFNTYGQAWLVPSILEQSFRFHEGYAIPQGMDVDNYRKAVEQLSLNDPPQVFGMHANADIAFRTRQTQLVLATMLNVQPKEGGGGGAETREEVVLRVVGELQTRLPIDYKREHVREAIKKQGGGKPLNICLQQEVDRLQKVLALVRAMLSSLKLAIAGTIVMSAELANALDALFMARVPVSWTKASQLEAPGLGVWFGSVISRAEQLSGWLVHGRPHCFWLAGFFNPQGFLTANRQEVCRRHSKENWALDDVVNQTEVLRHEAEEVRRAPEEGIYLRSLFLDGCRWDKAANRLTDSEPKVLLAPLPVLWVTGVLADGGKAMGSSAYTAPCYKNPKRTDLNFVFAVDLRTEAPPSKWVLRGVCLLTVRE